VIKTVGILGAGQLARMLAQAGKPMGLEFIFLDPANDACAAGFGEHICADWDDEIALRQLGQRSDVVTFDFENVPESSARLIESLCPVYPPPRALFKSQDRLREKTMMQELEIPVAPFQAVSCRPDLIAAVEKIGLPCVLKTRRLGYDGKGQAVLRFQEDMERAWQVLGDNELICEGFVSFDAECSIIAARGKDGQTVYWPLTRNLHRDGVLAISMAPAFGSALQSRAESLIQRLLDHLDYTGVMALELFLKDGELLANEFAPRVHNSGHWTINGARTSQFENHLRAICGLSLGDTENSLRALMFNLLGEMPAYANQQEADQAPIPGLHWNDYHKTARAGRKIGHVTVTAESEAGLRARAAQLAGELGMATELNLETVMQGVDHQET
jgi:5-(carboxyamino)imidazole ribonucleotide synthase